MILESFSEGEIKETLEVDGRRELDERWDMEGHWVVVVGIGCRESRGEKNP